MTPRFLRLAALGASLLCFAQLSFAVEKKYQLPERGFFQMDVPAGWRDQVRQPPQSLPPTIAFRGGQAQRFEIFVTPIWPARPDVAPSTKDSIRRQVERAAEGVKSQALETNIRVLEFAGAAGPGYYFSATDRAPKPGEYKFMTQGIVKVSELVVTFTILTNDGQEEVAREALAMIKSAIHVRP
jgi:hypothetical protein